MKKPYSFINVLGRKGFKVHAEGIPIMRTSRQEGVVPLGKTLL
jgi:hypothetical protein